MSDASAREHIDKNSLTWLGISKWAKTKLENAQLELEVEGLSHDQTTALRREIAVLKALINLPDPPQTRTAPPPPMSFD